jgi:hypothetical protein
MAYGHAWQDALSRQTPHERQRWTLPACLAGELTSNDGQTADSLSQAIREQVLSVQATVSPRLLPAMRLLAVCGEEGRLPEPSESYLWKPAAAIRPLHMFVSGIYAHSLCVRGGPIFSTYDVPRAQIA